MRRANIQLKLVKCIFLAVPHASEVALVFMESHSWEKALSEGKVSETDYKLANVFGEAWTNFAKYG